MGKRKRFKRKGSKSSLQNSVANGSIEGLLAEQDVVVRDLTDRTIPLGPHVHSLFAT